MPRLVRDRLTWLLYAQLGVYGYFLYGINPSIPLLREEQDVSRTVAGLHGTVLALGALGAGFLYARLAGRLGRRPVLWGGLVCVCLGVVVYTATTALPVTLFGALLSSLGGSAVVIGTAAALSDHHGPAGPAAVSEANACAAGLGLLAPLALGAFVSSGLGWRAALLVTLVLVGVLGVVMGRVPFPAARPHEAVPEAVRGSRSLPTRYWWAWGVLVLCIGVEFSLAIWASDVLRQNTGASSGVAATGVTAMVGGMFVGRTVGARLSLRFSPDRVMYGALATAVAGFAVFWTSTTTALAMGGLVLCGLGMALHFPVGIVRAIRASAGRTDLAAGRASLAAALAIGAGPFVLGALSDLAGPHRASLIVPGMLSVAGVLVYLSRVPVSPRRSGERVVPPRSP
ncbi:MAG: MFS transporter [Actinomycetes bacterium]